MLPPTVRLAVFAALDRSPREELADPESVRGVLYAVALNEGYPVTEALEEYVDFLVAEFCAV